MTASIAQVEQRLTNVMDQGSSPCRSATTPYYDSEIARICEWLRKNRYTMHVKLNGSIELRKK